MSLLNKKQQARITLTTQTHVTGATKTLANADGPIQLIVNPAATLSALAVTFPATPFDGQVVTISAGGTMTTGTVVTALTVVANTGQGVLEPTAPGSTAAGKSVSYRYNLGLTKWFRLY
ncbi:hypothetical protein [Spirosoma litoris]